MKDVYEIIQKILLTEKGTRLSETENKYIFRVNPAANKAEIKQAVEELFKVKVTAVNTMKRKGKKKRERTASFGRTAHWKRAVVTLTEDSKIDLV
ncbi:MAG: large subunit ribosomal protein [Verrucomicrobiota bacterium]|jgi:large subunit ribosomal protein L23|nr:large subunit ribosomal protein [Verrucomicrobiota bacterium]MDK2962986.1 large subunit ribosomal protein [Verrucomicrobiota bacterium]